MFKNKLYHYLAYISLLIILDQATKTFLIYYLKTQPNYIYPLLTSLDIIYTWNYGISFGLFREYYQYSNLAFFVINNIIITYLSLLLKHSQTKLAIYGLILTISGAIGNLIDRAIRGAVFDFIFLYYKDLSFPTFNFADSFITIGAMLLILDYISDKNT